MPKTLRFPHAVGSHAPRWPFVLNKDSLQAQGLVGWWPMIGDTASRIRNHALPGGHNLSGEVAIHPTPTVFGSLGLDFLGSVATSDDGAILSSFPLTLTVWMWPRSVSIEHVAINIVNSAVGNQVLGAIDLAGSVGGDPMRAFVRNTAFRAASTSNAFLLNTPNFLFGSFNSSGHKRAILNGDVGNAGSETTNETAPTVNRTAIGEMGDSTPGGSADAILWDLRVYNRDLPDALAVHMYDPSTRWDLYYETGRVSYFFVPAVVGGDPSADTVLFTLGQHQPVIEPFSMIPY